MEANWEALEASLLHRCIVDAGACAAAASILGSYDWAAPEHGWFWKQIVETYETSGEPPSLATLRGQVLILPRDLHDDLNAALDAVEKAVPDGRPKALARMLSKRSAKRRILVTLDRATKRFAQGQDDAAVALLDRTFSGGVATGERPAARPLVPRKIVRIPSVERIQTGLFQLDDCIGGHGRGDLGILHGVTGVGKSSFGVSFTFSAIRQGFRVLYIDSENGERVTTARVLSRFTHIPHDLIESGSFTRETRDFLAAWLDRNHERLARQLQVLYIGVEQTTIADVEAAWVDLKSRDFVPDLVFFDSPDHLIMGEGGPFDPKYGWAYLTRVYRQITSMAQRHRAAVWVTTQADKSAEGKMAGTRHLAGSQGKGQIASLVLSVNLDPEGSPDTDRIIFVGKGRTQRARFSVKATCDFSRMLIKSPPIEAARAGP